jgi:hypothetical protein
MPAIGDDAMSRSQFDVDNVSWLPNYRAEHALSARLTMRKAMRLLRIPRGSFMHLGEVRGDSLRLADLVCGLHHLSLSHSSDQRTVLRCGRPA